MVRMMYPMILFEALSLATPPITSQDALERIIFGDFFLIDVRVDFLYYYERRTKGERDSNGKFQVTRKTSSNDQGFPEIFLYISTLTRYWSTASRFRWINRFLSPSFIVRFTF